MPGIKRGPAEVKTVRWVDLVIVAIVALSAWKGYRAGLLTSVAGLFAWVVGFFAASRYYYPLSVYLDVKWNLAVIVQRFIAKELPFLPSPAPHQSVSVVYVSRAAGLSLPSAAALATGVVQIIAFLAVLLAVEMIIHSVARSVASMIAVTPLAVADRLGGFVFGALWGCVWVLVLSVVATRLLPGADWQGSVILPYLQHVTRTFHVPWPLVM